nr:GGDEF domain-containing protein [Sedimentibacter sp.]
MTSSVVDMRSTSIIIVIGHILAVILLASYAIQPRSKNESVKIYLLAKLIQCIGWIMLVLRGYISDILSISVANSVFFAGIVVEMTSYLVLSGNYNKRIKQYNYVLIISFILIFNFVTVFYKVESIRVLTASLLTSLPMIYPTYKIISEKNSSVLQKIVCVFLIATIIMWLARAYLAVTISYSLNFLFTDYPNTWVFFAVSVVMLTGSTGFILLVKEKQDAEMKKAACFDELTDILNRRAFIQHFKESISMLLSKNEFLSFLLMDIDDFKNINDNHGHYVGDIVLKSFADIIKSNLREYDLFGRYGGEEFAVMLPGADEKESLEIAERLRKAVENSSLSFIQEIRYTVSIGVVTIAADKDINLEMLYKLSDKALYKAKEQGKNQVVGIRV